ncbi:TPA: DNA circularization protein [Citrobacter amalonaticus]
MTPWEDLRDASFRGVPFYLKDADGESGRRAIPRAYPKKETGWTEDNGAVLNSQQINGILLGADYQRQLDALLAALNTPGPGELVHPWFGLQRVQVGKVSHKLSTEEGGIAYISFEVYESGERLFPAATENTAVTVRDAADRVKEAFESGDFFEAMDGLGEMLDTWITDIESFVMNMPTTPTVLTEWLDRAGRLRGLLDEVLTMPATFISEAMGLVSGVRDTVSEPFWAMHIYDQLIARWEGSRAEQAATHTLSTDVFTVSPDIYNGVAGFAGSVPDEILTPSQVMLDNIAGFKQLVLVAAMTGKAETLSGISFSQYEPYTGDDHALLHSDPVSLPAGAGAWTSADDIMRAGDVLASQLSRQAAIAVDGGWRDIWRALRHLRFSVLNDVQVRAAQLPEVRKLHVSTTTSVALLAWRETGNTERRDDIVARNRLRDPSFIHPSQTTEVTE